MTSSASAALIAAPVRRIADKGSRPPWPTTWQAPGSQSASKRLNLDPNVVAKVEGYGGPGLLLETHLDTVETDPALLRPE